MILCWPIEIWKSVCVGAREHVCVCACGNELRVGLWGVEWCKQWCNVEEVLVAVAWTVSQGDQEQLNPRYHPPPETLYQAQSVSLVMQRSTCITQLSTHTSLNFTDMHLLSGLYWSFTSFRRLQQLFLIAWVKDEQKPETVRGVQCGLEERKE